MAKRLRILAGPNGSGKTSIYKDLRDEFNWGVFVNADIIEQSLRENGELNLSDYSVSKISYESFADAYAKSTLAQKSMFKLTDMMLVDDVLIIKNANMLDSYFSAFVASFIQSMLIENEVSFSYETVMSHPSKLDLIRLAKDKGYRVYLYFVSTVSAQINVNRIKARVAVGGHNVDEKKVYSRYTRSLGQLSEAIRLSDRAYVFDNSGKTYEWIAEYDGLLKQLTVYQEKEWFDKYVLKKV